MEVDDEHDASVLRTVRGHEVDENVEDEVEVEETPAVSPERSERRRAVGGRSESVISGRLKRGSSREEKAESEGLIFSMRLATEAKAI